MLAPHIGELLREPFASPRPSSAVHGDLGAAPVTKRSRPFRVAGARRGDGGSEIRALPVRPNGLLLPLVRRDVCAAREESVHDPLGKQRHSGPVEMAADVRVDRVAHVGEDRRRVEELDSG